MALQFPIRVEKNSTYKMKITLKTPQGALNLTDIGFEGELKNSVYDDTGLPLQFDVVDAYNGSLFVSIPSDVSKQMDYYDGVYVIRYVAQDGLKYRLIEGTTEVVWEGRGNSQPVDTSDVEHLTIILDGEPELETLATVGLPGPKLTYDDLTESDKENLREGVYEAVQDQVDVAVEAKEVAETAGNNAQNAASLIQLTLLPEARSLKDTTEALKNEAANSAQDAANSAQDAELNAQNVASIRDNLESIEANVISLEDSTETFRNQTEAFRNQAESFANTAGTEATASTASSAESKGYRDEALSYRDQAETFRDQAQQAAQSAFQSDGTWEPSASKEYPDVPTQDTRWTLKEYLFTSGDLSGKQSVDGDTLIYEVSEGAFVLLRTGSVILGNPITELVGADGISRVGPSITLNPTMVGARPNAWVPTWTDVQGKPAFATRWPTANEVGALPDSYIPSWASISGKPSTATRWPTPSEVGALPDSYVPDWGDVQNKPEYLIDPVPMVSTVTSGTLSGSKLITWIPDTTSVAPSVTLGDGVEVIVIKDVSGNAGSNNIILSAPSGKTLEGDSSITVDVNFGWVRLQLSNIDYKVISGG